MLVKINNTDITSNIIAESYDVNRNNIFANEWTDANGTLHKDLLRTQISGKFTLKFLTAGAYETFVTLYKTNDVGSGLMNISVYVNNICEQKAITAYCSFKPIMRKSLTNNFYKEFSFEILEK